MPETVLRSEFEAGFRSITDVLIHVYNGENFWRSVLNNGYPYTSLEASASVGIADLQRLFSELHQSTRDILAQQSDLEQMIYFTSRKGRAMNSTFAEIVLTVVNHGAYHRGNISTMLRVLGHKGVSKDYAFYLNDIRAQ